MKPLKQRLQSDRKEYFRNWRANHREQINEYNRKYYAEHKKKRNTERRKWRKQHPGIPAAQSKRYREKYPIKKLAHNAATCKPHWYKCMVCGATEDLHEHHPNYANKDMTITLCRQCHNDLHNGKLILEEIVN